MYSLLDAAGGTEAWPEDDQLYALLIERADALIGQDELEAIGEALEAYEGRRRS